MWAHAAVQRRAGWDVTPGGGDPLATLVPVGRM
jgi:hypothetical protein